MERNPTMPNPVLTLILDDTGNLGATGPLVPDLNGVCLLWQERRTGRIRIAGPIQQKVLIYGLLEGAKDAVRDWHAEHAKDARIVAPPPGFNAAGNGGTGG